MSGCTRDETKHLFFIYWPTYILIMLYYSQNILLFATTIKKPGYFIASPFARGGKWLRFDEIFALAELVIRVHVKECIHAFYMLDIWSLFCWIRIYSDIRIICGNEIAIISTRPSSFVYVDVRLLLHACCCPLQLPRTYLKRPPRASFRLRLVFKGFAIITYNSAINQ